MKRNIFYLLVSGLLAVSFSSQAQTVNKGKFTVKAGAGIGIGNGVAMTSPLNLETEKSSVTDFGVDLGYSFWRRGNMSLDVSAGLGYMTVSTKLGIGKWDYSYAAGANADMDGNRYDRHYELRGLEQKIDAGFFTVPVYLSYRYCFGKRFALRADAGVRMGFRMSAGIGSCSGEGYSYGIYPEYDNLRIDADWMNGFGDTVLGKEETGTPEVNGINASVILGIGAEIGIAGPVSLDLGVRYAVGVTDVYGNSTALRNPVTEECAPVSYTVAGGERVRPLTDYSTKSALSQLAVRAGIIVRF